MASGSRRVAPPLCDTERVTARSIPSTPRMPEDIFPFFYVSVSTSLPASPHAYTARRWEVKAAYSLVWRSSFNWMQHAWGLAWNLSLLYGLAPSASFGSLLLAKLT